MLEVVGLVGFLLFASMLALAAGIGITIVGLAVIFVLSSILYVLRGEK
jgi:hypothetical protein